MRAGPWRTTTLHEAQRLNQALREVNTSLDSFVHIVAHDLKGPATNLERLLEVYWETTPGPEQDHIITLVEREVHRLTATIQGLLQVLHSQHGVAGSTSEQVTFADVYATVQAEVAELLYQQQGQLVANFDEAPTICFPRIYLESILKNLVSNALKYRDPTRSPLIQVRTQRRAATVVLTVADNGQGIDLSRDRERLFQPFMRLTTEGQGTGLGLYMVQTITIVLPESSLTLPLLVGGNNSKSTGAT
jgi:signal transduction histidine kinase